MIYRSFDAMATEMHNLDSTLKPVSDLFDSSTLSDIAHFAVSQDLPNVLLLFFVVNLREKWDD